MNDTPIPASHAPETPPPNPGPEPARFEFIPVDAEMLPQALPRTTGFEAWLMRNTRPLLFICLAFTLEALIAAEFSHAMHARPRPPAAPTAQASAGANETQASSPEDATAEAMLRLEHSPIAYVHLAIAGLGFLASAALVVAFAASSDERHWIRALFAAFPLRPMPALRAMDLLAAIAVFSALSSTLGMAISYHFNGRLDEAARMVYSMQIVAVVACLVIALCVHLARRRGGGQHGALGFWPFWYLSRLIPRRSVLVDIGIGAGAWVLALWLINVSALINAQLVEWSGSKVDQHQLVEVLSKDQPLHVLIAIAISATLGAALFEEIFFRGMLYNVLRRYFGGLYGALIAAFIFSILHGIWSQVMPLMLIGLILTWLYERTGRLVASMTFHFTNNLAALATMLLLHAAK